MGIKKKVTTIEKFFNAKTVNLMPSGDFQVHRMFELPAILRNVREHVKHMRFAKVVPCDVCIENFVLDKKEQLELGSRIFGEALYFSAKEMTANLLDELYPEFDAKPSAKNGRVRVHGITQDGKYQTYCHFCDADMCLSEIENGPNWDRIYELQYREEFLIKLPELLEVLLLRTKNWNILVNSFKSKQLLERIDLERIGVEVELPEIRGFYFSGCTAWMVNVDILVDEGHLNREFVFFVHEGRKWTAHFATADDPLIRRIGQKLYKPVVSTTALLCL